MKRRDAAEKSVERELFIRSRITRVAEPVLARLVASVAEEVTFAPGAVLYRKGDPAHDFYAFMRGEIEVSADGEPPWILEDQSGMGHFEVLADQPRISTVTAVTQVRAVRVTADAYLDFLEEHFELVMAALLDVTKDVHELSLSLAPDGGFGVIAPPPPILHPPSTGPMNLVQRIEVLRDSPVLRKANVQALVRLARLVHVLRVPAGGTVFRRGEAEGKFYLVAEGLVEATREAPFLRARFGRGALVCGLGALGTADNHYVATALSPVTTFSFSEEDFFDVMEEHFALTRSVLASIASDCQELLAERTRRAARGSVR